MNPEATVVLRTVYKEQISPAVADRLYDEQGSSHPLLTDEGSHQSIGTYLDDSERPATLAYWDGWTPAQYGPLQSPLTRAGLGLARMAMPTLGESGAHASLRTLELPGTEQLEPSLRKKLASSALGYLLRTRSASAELEIIHGLAPVANRTANLIGGAYNNNGFSPTNRSGHYGRGANRQHLREYTLDFRQYSRTR